MAPDKRYRSFLLRLWQANDGPVPEWRFSLEEAGAHQRHGFTNLGSLVAFLERQIRGARRPAPGPAAHLAAPANKEELMGATVNLSQGCWRLHTAMGLLSKDELRLHPAQPSGPNSDVVLTFAATAETLALPEGVALTGDWFEGTIRPEDAWDTPVSKGLFRAKVVAAVPIAHPSQQIIQIYQTNYEWGAAEHTGALTIYTGRLYQPTPPEDQPTPPPVFFGYGADNAGRQWLTFSLAPSDVQA